MRADSDPEQLDVETLPIILVGSGHRGRAWLEVIGKASRLQLVAHVPLEALPRALAQHPQAQVAVALPPRACLAAALALAAQKRVGLLEAPIAAHAEPILDAERLQVALGWATALDAPLRAVEASGATRLILECRGLPEEPGGSLEEQLPHALAAAERLLPGAQLRAAACYGESRLELEWVKGAVELGLKVHADGHGLSLDARGPRGAFRWTLDASTESLTQGSGSAKPAVRPATPAVERALRQLVAPLAEATLPAALQHAARADEIWARCQQRPFVAARRFAPSRAREAKGPLAAWGFEAPAASGAELAPAPREVPAPLGRCTELWSFRAGLKPVVFLTLEPAEEKAVLAAFGDVHVERLTRRVRIEAQDRWVDRRDEGQPRVELYLSKSATLARRAAALQQVAPTDKLAELGELLGYPRCCVKAFAELRDRANNTANRYATAARTTATGPWPWQLNNLSQMLLAYFPCRYDCPHALEQARAALDALEKQHRGALAATREALARTTLYFSHGVQLSVAGGRVRVGEGSSAELARLAAHAATHLRLTDTALELGALRLPRTDPGLGLWAPFA
ncbi:MAG: hypothetical protein IPJ65_15230 [Archangiaceae bacterium]|nr:hypothetical protein [Archangiaceae bacterium]